MNTPPILIPITPVLNEADNDAAIEEVDRTIRTSDNYGVHSFEGQRFMIVTEYIGAFEREHYHN